MCQIGHTCFLKGGLFDTYTVIIEINRVCTTINMLLKMIKSVSIFNRPPHTKSYGTILRSIGAGLQANSNSLDFDRDVVITNKGG